MSTEQMLQRHVRREGDVEQGSDVEDLGSYGLLRGVRDRCSAVEFRKRDGTILAVPYPLIEQFLFSPTEGIILRAAGREIRIRGRYLNHGSGKPGLFSALTRGRAQWIAEQSRVSPPCSESVTVIESIAW